MKYTKMFLIVIGVLSLFACAMEHQVQDYKNYSVNRVKKANLGSTMLSHKVASWFEEKTWVGLLKSEDGWKYSKKYSEDSFKEELIYTGRSGNTLHISYREYKQDFARPAFFQELRYDMWQSRKVVFKQYKLKIINATNEYIKFVVLDD